MLSVGLPIRLLAIGDGRVDVGAAAQLGAEQHLHRIVQLIGEVHHRGVEHHQGRAQRRHRGHHRTEDRGVDDGFGHRPGLVDGDDHVALHHVLPAAVADQPFRDDGVVFRQPMLQIGGNGSGPVDVGVPAGPADARGPVQCAVHRGPGAVGDPLLDLPDHRRDHRTRGGAGLLGQQLAHPDQRGHQIDVRFHRVQQFRLQQQLVQLQPLDRVPLHDLDDGGREVGADVAQPADHPRRGRAEAGRPFPVGLPRSAAVVDRGQRAVDALVVGGQPAGRAQRVIVGSADQQPPAPQPLGLVGPAAGCRSSSSARIGHDAPCSSNRAVASTPSARVRSRSGGARRRAAAGQGPGGAQQIAPFRRGEAAEAAPQQRRHLEELRRRPGCAPTGPARRAGRRRGSAAALHRR